jgi:hypothetical protein
MDSSSFAETPVFGTKTSLCVAANMKQKCHGAFHSYRQPTTCSTRQYQANIFHLLLTTFKTRQSV